jgi:hypothetical protein
VRFRTPRCAGTVLNWSDARDTAWAAHPPHTFNEYEHGSSATGFPVGCPGWSEDDAAASLVVAALREHSHEPDAFLECGWRVATVLLRLMEPDLADMTDTGGLNDRVDRIYGVEVRITEGGDSSAWLLATLAGPLAQGRLT